MSRSQGVRSLFYSGLVLCALWGMCILVPASVGATDAATEKPKAATETTEQTPEQAAGGMKNLLRIRKACEADAKRMCADIKPGGGRL